jgi:hypothetical protein
MPGSSSPTKRQLRKHCVFTAVSCPDLESCAVTEEKIWKNASWKVLQKLSQIDLTETSQFYFWHFQILLKESSEARSNKRISWDFSNFRVGSIRCFIKSSKSFFGAPRYVCGFDVYKYDSEPSNRFQPYKYMIYIYVSYTSILGLYMSSIVNPYLEPI